MLTKVRADEIRADDVIRFESRNWLVTDIYDRFGPDGRLEHYVEVECLDGTCGTDAWTFHNGETVEVYA